ncbi:hypothetical protein K469DRAFT_713841 [Zopfia rhizophila CBS 207.26]|uniref:Uncharacterized protein n=1 Tax=Zopfia rhizophila CBS 207.26 TaxID=1314779 RepID=A0A6A6DT70_9PEZI|nr:hypothetical protein K469DRAFT_713841 [Zopfia rhizophila CBS 207.26]
MSLRQVERHTLSPTAHLLRNSRLFSLPPPLPRPQVEGDYGSGIIKSSSTATLPYPTHQAIAAPPSSLSRGDWGLKRPLPLKSKITQTSNPVVRIKQLDTIEHITDFESAGDHVRTREKWAEMGIPMLKGKLGKTDMSSTSPKSAFEEVGDVTSYEELAGLDAQGVFFEALRERAVKRLEEMGRSMGEVEEEEVEMLAEVLGGRKSRRISAQADGMDKILKKLEGEVKTAKERVALRKERIESWKNLTPEERGTRTVKRIGKRVQDIATQIENYNVKVKRRIDRTQREMDAVRRGERSTSKPTPTPSKPSSTYSPLPLPTAIPPSIGARWKHEGPWLPSMGAAEFASYLSHKISYRRAEFSICLEEYVRHKLYTQRRTSSLQTETWPEDPEEAKRYLASKENEWSTITKADISTSIRKLREDCARDPIQSELVQRLIIPFLRLSPMKLKLAQYATSDVRTEGGLKFQDDTGPLSLSTHPSAGLSYVRTRAYLENHPILGPQAHSTPVPGRVVQPRNANTSREQYARIGVAGFITNDNHGGFSPMEHNKSGDPSGLNYLDVEAPGGRKIWINPKFGSVDADGRVLVNIEAAHSEAVKVKNGQLDDVAPVRKHQEKDPLKGLSKAVGSSGIKGLEEEDLGKLDASQQQAIASIQEVLRAAQNGEHGEKAEQ